MGPMEGGYAIMRQNSVTHVYKVMIEIEKGFIKVFHSGVAYRK